MTEETQDPRRHIPLTKMLGFGPKYVTVAQRERSLQTRGAQIEKKIDEIMLKMGIDDGEVKR